MSNWQDVLQLNNKLPHGLDEKREDSQFNGYCLQIQSVNVTLSQPLRDRLQRESGSVRCRIAAFLFDSFHQRFFGRPFHSTLTSATIQGDQLKAKLDQLIYFLTPTVSNEEAVWILVEIVAEVSNGVELSCGWVQLKALHPGSYKQLPDLRKKSQPVAAAREAIVHAGSVRCFISMREENISSCKQQGSLTYQLFRHSGLQSCADPFPEDALIGRGEPVPGLLPGPDPLRKAQLAPTATVTFDNVVLHITPSILTFEEELKRFVLEDRRAVDAGSRSVEIVDRRLKVGVHNGWEYVDCEVNISLALGQESSSSSKRQPLTHRRSMSRGKMQKILEKGVLVAKNPVQVEVPQDPRMAVVFVLEYLVSEQAAMAGTPKAQQLISVRYAAFSPDQAAGQQLKLEMTGGPDAQFPDGKLLYKQTARLRSAASATQFKVVMEGGMNYATSQQKQELELQQQQQMQQHVQQQQQQQQQQMYASSNLGLHQANAFADPDALVPSARTAASANQLGMSTARTGSSGQLSRRDEEAPAGSLTLQQHNQNLLMSNPMMLLSQLMLQSSALSSSGRVNGEVTEENGILSSRAGPLLAPSSASLQRHLNTAVCTLSRSEFARLATSGFPAIVDDYGEAPEIVDESRRVNIDLRLEQQDSLVCNELVLQFLAFTAGPTAHPKSVFFTFQLYRFPQFTTERLLLADSSFTDDGRSFVLHRAAGPGLAAHGYEARFAVDPTLLRPGELMHFANYLHNHILHIDIFDADSLLFLGSCGMSLRHLLRQGRRGVQASTILGVVLPQEEAGAATNGAQVHVKVANLGSRPDPRRAANGNTGTSGSSSSTTRLIEPAAPSHSAESGRPRPKVVRVHQGDLPKELREQLPNGTAATEAERQRKLARLRAVKAANPQLVSDDPAMLSLSAYQQERQRNERQLHTIDFVRERSKDGVIQDLLESSISQQHTIHTSFGCTEFFELAFDNPANQEQEISIEVMDEEKKLQILIDPALVLAMKAHFGVATATDHQLFSRRADSNTGQLASCFVRPKERILIPFRYFETSAVEQRQSAVAVKPRTSSGASASSVRQRLGDSREGAEGGGGGGGGVSGDGRSVKVYLRGSGGSVLSMLLLQVNRQPAAVDQTIRFYQSENTFFKRSIRLPPLSDPPEGRVAQPTLICSDGAAVCHVKQPQASSDPIDVFVKLSCGESPKMQQLLLAVYTDPFQLAPQLVTQLLVQSLQQVDITCSLGQPVQRSLLIRGFSNSRQLRCFTSSPEEIRVEPAEAFLLPATTSREVSVGVQPQSIGTSSYRVSLVDIESHQLLKCWLYNVSCDLPELIRTLELTLALGGGKHCNRKFNYTNEYSVSKRFAISCNRPDLLQFSPSELQLAGKAEGTIRLHFVPQMQPCRANVFFFIYDEQGRNEETVLFKINYSAAVR